MKILLSIGLYVGLIIVLGYVLAWMAPPEALGHEVGDDEL